MPNILERLGGVWSALAGRKKATAQAPVAANPIPLPGAYNGFYGWGLYGTDSISPAGPTYLNPIVGAIVGWLARNFPEPELLVVREGEGDQEDTPIPDHPLLDLLDRPNEIFDFYSFFYLTILSDVTDGNTFWLKRTTKGGDLFDLWWLPPWDVSIVPDETRKSAILRYDVRVNNVIEKYEPQEIVHIKAMPNPADPRRGMTSLAAAAASIRAIDRMCLYDEALLTNFGGVPYMLSPSAAGEFIHPDNVERLRMQWHERQAGKNTGKPFVSSQGLKAERLGFSPEEMALDQMPLRHTAMITAAAGLSPMVLGLPDPSKTFSNLAESRMAAYENALMPLQGRIAEAIGRYLPELVAENERVEWSYTEIDCLQEDRTAIIERGVKATGGKAIMTRNEARSEIDLEPVEGGDDFAAPPVIAPPGGPPAPAKPPSPGPQEPAEAEPEPEAAAKPELATNGKPKASKANPNHDRAGRFAAGRGGGGGGGGGGGDPGPGQRDYSEVGERVEAKAAEQGLDVKVEARPPEGKAETAFADKANAKGKEALVVEHMPKSKVESDDTGTRYYRAIDSTHPGDQGMPLRVETLPNPDGGGGWLNRHHGRDPKGQHETSDFEHATRRAAEKDAKGDFEAGIKQDTSVKRLAIRNPNKYDFADEMPLNRDWQTKISILTRPVGSKVQFSFLQDREDILLRARLLHVLEKMEAREDSGFPFSSRWAADELKYNPRHNPPGSSEGGQFGSGHGKPGGGGGGGGGESLEDVDEAIYRGDIVGKDEHVHASVREKDVAEMVGGTWMPDNEPIDVRVGEIGAEGSHALEVKTMMKRKANEISVHKDALDRKVTFNERNPATTFHTVVIDDRNTYQGGAHAANYSGHPMYYTRASGRWSTGRMEPVRDAAHLKELMDMPFNKLPKKAQGKFPKGEARKQLKIDARKAHADRLAKDQKAKAKKKEKEAAKA